MKTNKITEDSDNWGAEAILFRNEWFEKDAIYKIRIPKEYRIKQIDEQLREKRMLSESKLMKNAKKIGVKTPFIFEIDLVTFTIIMEYIQGLKVKDLLNSNYNTKQEKYELIQEIGKLVAKMHSEDIIHGDLTTSNILYHQNEIYFIDFGLGKISNAIEDKAVDILLMKKCFNSTHANMSKELFLAFQKGYKKINLEYKKVFKRAIKVEARGRHLKEYELVKQYML